MLGFFISGSRAQLVGLRLLDIKKQTKCNQLGAYPPLRDHSIILKQQKMKRAKPVDINAAP